MKIAMPYLNGQVNAHFGTSREFIVLEAENGKITDKKILNNKLLHNHGGLAGLLSAEGVGVIITGGIGAPMAEALQRTGLQVVSGASGEVEKVALDFLSGQLVTSGSQCDCGGHH
jgi:predicted Fe-Mo cluster-binding NifX family protein